MATTTKKKATAENKVVAPAPPVKTPEQEFAKLDNEGKVHHYINIIQDGCNKAIEIKRELQERIHASVPLAMENSVNKIQDTLIEEAIRIETILSSIHETAQELENLVIEDIIPDEANGEEDEYAASKEEVEYFNEYGIKLDTMSGELTYVSEGMHDRDIMELFSDCLQQIQPAKLKEILEEIHTSQNIRKS